MGRSPFSFIDCGPPHAGKRRAHDVAASDGAYTTRHHSSEAVGRAEPEGRRAAPRPPSGRSSSRPWRSRSTVSLTGGPAASDVAQLGDLAAASGTHGVTMLRWG